MVEADEGETEGFPEWHDSVYVCMLKGVGQAAEWLGCGGDTG